MVDTVVLRLPLIKGMISKPMSFSPPLIAFKEKSVCTYPTLFMSHRNPTALEKRTGKYFPRLKYISPYLGKGHRKHYLMIEFSAPKILFGNNFDELEDSDFDSLIKELQARLSVMGINVAQKRLKEANVSRIHYGKNIALTDYTSPSMIINQLSKAQPFKRLDLSQHEYRNGGLLLRYHASDFELVFYDKIKDLHKAKSISEKRAFESDNYCQFNILDEIEGRKPFEVVRMELRLNSTRRIKMAYKQIGCSANLIFQECFKEEIAQKTLQYNWQEVERDLGYVVINPTDPLQIIGEIKRMTPKASASFLLKAAAYFTMTNASGAASLRTALSMKAGWHALKKQMAIYGGIKPGGRYEPIHMIPAALKAFTPLKLAHFPI